MPVVFSNRGIVVAPAGSSSVAGALPAWLSGAAVLEWVEIANSDMAAAQTGFTSPGGLPNQVVAYSGGAVQESGSVLWVAGGGHADYAGNEPYSIRLSDSAPTWTRRRDPTATVANDVEYYADGRPSARHSYYQCQFINRRGKFFWFGGGSVWGSGNSGSIAVDSFDPNTNDWDSSGTYPDMPSGPGSACGVSKDASENVYIHNYNSGDLYKWTEATNTWSTLSNIDVANSAQSHCVDTSRNRIFRTAKGAISAATIALDTGVKTDRTLSGANAADIDNGMLVYDPNNDCFWFWRWNSTNLYRIHPTTFAVTIESVTGTVPNNTFGNGLHEFYGRFNYCPELKGLVFVKDANANVFFIRTSA